MWTELPTEDRFVDCREPYSFYFDLVNEFWKAPTCRPYNVALHRICTLARKMGAQTLVIEDVLHRPEIQHEIDDLDETLGGNGSAEAISLSFLSESIDDDASVSQLSRESVLGQTILVNYKRLNSSEFDCSYLYEARVRTPRQLNPHDPSQHRDLLNNYIHSKRDLTVRIRGIEFSLPCVYYSQQNQVTSVCAHACLQMALNSIESTDPLVTTRSINTELGITPPITGLTLEQIRDFLGARGLQPSYFDFDEHAGRSDHVAPLYSVIESGCPALLAFTTASPVAHVVPVFGHTLNSDEWHPQALPGYSGPADAPFYSSSSWADHFLIHDDNYGPYFCMSSQSFAGNAHLRPILVAGLFPSEVIPSPLEVEGVATAWLRNTIPAFRDLGSGRWWDYMTGGSWSYILRTLLISRDRYLMHLTDSVAHDGSRVQPQELDNFRNLPDQFWMIEFSMPGLYTGNKSKLGEILVSSQQPIDPGDLFDSVLAMRAPSLWVDWRDPKQGLRSSLAAHSPLYRRLDGDHEW